MTPTKQDVNCPLCGTPCRIVGKTTMHYEPVKIDKEKLVQMLENLARDRYEYTIEDLAQAIIKHLEDKR